MMGIFTVRQSERAQKGQTQTEKQREVEEPRGVRGELFVSFSNLEKAFWMALWRIQQTQLYSEVQPRRSETATKVEKKKPKR
jgi:hypothetical protein